MIKSVFRVWALATLILALGVASAGEIHQAVRDGDRDRVAALLRSDPSLVSQADDEDAWLSKPIHFAAMGGHLEIAALLLEAGADLEAGDSDESRPLDVAANAGQIEMVEFLLDRGADIDRKDNNGSCPLSFASRAGHADVMRLLIERGADLAAVHEDGASGILLQSSFRGSPEVIALLIERGADVNYAQHRGATPLMYACRSGNAAVARSLIEHGADLNRAEENGLTALHHAAEQGRAELVTLLMNAGASAKARELSFGRTPVHAAVLSGQAAVIQALVDGGAALGIRDHAGRTPVDLARKHGHGALSELLCAHGAPASETALATGMPDHAPAPRGDARVWYLDHSGWVVQTASHLLVFDYHEMGPRPDEPHLSNGHILPQEIDGRNVLVFVSHEHGDHYNPVIWQWADELDHVTYVLGFAAADAGKHIRLGPREVREIEGCTVRTIESNDSGVGFVVEVDGVSVFHAGDHANRLRDMTGPYKAEIDYLADVGVAPDIAFLPISGCNFGDQVAVRIGTHYTLGKLKPKVFCPMHMGGAEYVGHDFIADCRDQFPETRMFSPEADGDAFVYSGGAIASHAGASGAPAATAGGIHEAVAAGDAERTAEILRAHPEAIRQQADNRTRDYPIHTAALAGHVEIARLLLDAGADLEAEDADGSTPLHDACIHRHQEMVAFLIEQGADVSRRDHNAAYALSFAVSGGDTAVVRMVLDAGADLYHRSRQGLTLLHFAAARGMESLADTLLAHGEDVNARTARGETPLTWATMRGQMGMARKLLAHGADPNLGNEFNETPLHHVAARGDLEMGRLLLEWGADPNAAQSGWGATPLFYTVWDGRAEFARLLIGHGADVNHEADGHRALARAVQEGQSDLVSALLDGGAEVDVPEPNLGCTPLQVAALRGYRDIAEMLLDRGAALHSANRRGETALELAGRYGHSDVVGLLVERGARGRVPEANQGVAAFADLPEREAVVWFLEHSGWGIKTKNHLLVFDYFERRRAPVAPGFCNGHVSPAELADENVTVFVSHVHGDHYDERIWEWREQLPNISYVLGFEPEGLEELPPFEYIGPRQTRTLDGVKITTIESNDSGVGFLVEVDGLTILHPGDHANRQRDFSGPYQAEIDWLAQRGVRPDIAFFPISGCGFGDQVAVKMGVHYALETLRPHVFFPMHNGDLSRRYQEFIDESRPQFPEIRMEAAAIKGDRFHYSDGNVEVLASRLAQD